MTGRHQFGVGFVQEEDPALEPILGRIAERQLFADLGHGRIAHLKGEKNTAHELYLAASPDVSFSDWRPPAWFDWSIHTGGIRYNSPENFGPDRTKIMQDSLNRIQAVIEAPQ